MNYFPEITTSELVLSAIFFLQQKNGVTASEITKFVCGKRNCKPGKVKPQVRRALDRAIKNGIFTKKKGLYRIQTGFGEKLNLKKDSKEPTERKARVTKARSLSAAKKMNLDDQGRKGKRREGSPKISEAGTIQKSLTFHIPEILPTQKWSRLSTRDSKNKIAESLISIKEDITKENEDFDTSEEDYDDDDVDYFAEESSPKNIFGIENSESENDNNDDIRTPRENEWKYTEYDRFDDFDNYEDERGEETGDDIDYTNVQSERLTEKETEEAKCDLDDWSRRGTDSEFNLDSGDDSKGSLLTIDGSNYEKSDINDSDTDTEKLFSMDSMIKIKNLGNDYQKGKRGNNKHGGPQMKEKESDDLKDFEEDSQEKTDGKREEIEEKTQANKDTANDSISEASPEQTSVHEDSPAAGQTFSTLIGGEKLLKDDSRSSKREAPHRSVKRKGKSKERKDSPAKRDRRK